MTAPDLEAQLADLDLPFAVSAANREFLLYSLHKQREMQDKLEWLFQPGNLWLEDVLERTTRLFYTSSAPSEDTSQKSVQQQKRRSSTSAPEHLKKGRLSEPKAVPEEENEKDEGSDEANEADKENEWDNLDETNPVLLPRTPGRKKAQALKVVTVPSCEDEAPEPQPLRPVRQSSRVSRAVRASARVSRMVRQSSKVSRAEHQEPATLVPPNINLVEIPGKPILVPASAAASESSSDESQSPMVRRSVRIGRTAAVTAKSNISKNVEELSNLSKKKRRPTERSTVTDCVKVDLVRLEEKDIGLKQEERERMKAELDGQKAEEEAERQNKLAQEEVERQLQAEEERQRRAEEDRKRQLKVEEEQRQRAEKVRKQRAEEDRKRKAQAEEEEKNRKQQEQQQIQDEEAERLLQKEELLQREKDEADKKRHEEMAKAKELRRQLEEEETEAEHGDEEPIEEADHQPDEEDLTEEDEEDEEEPTSTKPLPVPSISDKPPQKIKRVLRPKELTMNRSHERNNLRKVPFSTSNLHSGSSTNKKRLPTTMSASHILSSEKANKTRAPFATKFGSCEKAKKNGLLSNAFSFFSTAQKEKKPSAEELQKQREDRMKEKELAKEEQMREKEEVKKRQIEEKRAEREEKMRRVEENRKQQEEALKKKASEKALKSDQSRLEKLAEIEKFKENQAKRLDQDQKRREVMDEKRRQMDEEEGKKKVLVQKEEELRVRIQKEQALKTLKPSNVEKHDLNTTYDAATSPNEPQGAFNSTFTKTNVVAELANTTITKETSSIQSYDITPARHELPPEPLHDPENYDINDLKSDDDTDDEEQPRKEIPPWALGHSLKNALITQCYQPPDLDEIFEIIDLPDLSQIFREQKRRFFKRTSSAQWDHMPTSFKFSA